VIVVSDTSPLNYLILIEEVSILAALYQRVLIPEMVFASFSIRVRLHQYGNGPHKHPHGSKCILFTQVPQEI
jgi:predicted nucleic acid-binding protein